MFFAQQKKLFYSQKSLLGKFCIVQLRKNTTSVHHKNIAPHMLWHSLKMAYATALQKNLRST